MTEDKLRQASGPANENSRSPNFVKFLKDTIIFRGIQTFYAMKI